MSRLVRQKHKSIRWFPGHIHFNSPEIDVEKNNLMSLKPRKATVTAKQSMSIQEAGQKSGSQHNAHHRCCWPTGGGYI